MEQQNEQLQGKTPRSPLSILIPVCILLAGLLLWFFLYERPHQNALSQFRAAAAEYEETYRTYFNAVDACNRKVLAWQEALPALDAECAELKQVLESGEPVRTADADAARALLKEAETIKKNVPMSEPVIAMHAWDPQGLSTRELINRWNYIGTETGRITAEIPYLEETAASINVPDFDDIARRFRETQKALEESILLRQKIGISLDDFEDDIRIYDPFENLEIVFEGTSPDGRVRLNKKSTVGVDREYAFGTDSNSGLKNGDLVTVRVDFGDSMESFNQNLAAQYKTVLCEWTRDYVVEGLPYSLTEFSQIDEPTLDVIKEKAVRTITGQAEQKEGLVVVDDIKLIGHCFLTRKSPTSLLDTARNYLFLVYSVKCSVDLSKDGHDYKNTVNYVTSVRFSNLLGMPDGKTALSLENAALPTSTIKLNTGVPTLLVFLPRTFEFAGYEDTNTLFYNEIAPLTDRFTCEDNIGTAGEAVTIAN